MSKLLSLLGFDEETDDDRLPYQDEGPAYTRPEPRVRTERGHSKPVYIAPQEAAGPAPARREERRPVALAGGAASPMRMVVFQPQSFEDTQTLIDSLKGNRPVIVNLENLNVDAAQRVLDFVSGAIYALDGSVRKISKGIFLMAPAGVDISGNLATGLPGEIRSQSHRRGPEERP